MSSAFTYIKDFDIVTKCLSLVLKSAGLNPGIMEVLLEALAFQSPNISPNLIKTIFYSEQNLFKTQKHHAHATTDFRSCAVI